MNISVFGLGYVGSVSAVCLAQMGHRVVGVDVNAVKVEAINAGETPITEAGMAEGVRTAVATGALRASVDAREAVLGTDVSFLCVGTPSQPTGDVDLSYLETVCGEIGDALAEKTEHHLIAVRSTILPGTTGDVLTPLLECRSGKVCGRDFDVVFHPEFLREGTAIEDFYSPARTVIGEQRPGSGDSLVELYAGIDAPLVRTDLRTAEMVKYADNAFHAMKVAFANEIGSLAKRMGIDGRNAMEIFCTDTKLNISPAYLRPGYAFGGSCLPKDLRAILFRGRSAGLETPLLRAIQESNEDHKRLGYDLVRRAGKRRVGILGLSFKAGTDDLRESPIVDLVETLVGKGYEVSVYDPNVVVERLIGANRTYIERVLPHVARLLRDSAEDVIREAEVVVVTHQDCVGPELMELGEDHVLVDLVGMPKEKVPPRPTYAGVAW